MTSKKILSVLVLAAALSLPLGNSAKAATASGQTDVSVVLPEIIILHYISDITLTFPNITQDIDESSGSWNVDWSGTASTSTDELASGNLNTGTGDLASGTVTAHIPNVWAIRGFSSGREATVDIAIDTADLSDGTYDLTMSNPKVDDNNGNVGISITTSLNGIWKNQATIGDVELDFNFDDDLASGTYTGGQYTITAETV